MANRTVKDAKSVRGTNPQFLVEKIIRSRIYESKYWKEECFALSAELLVDKAMELRFIGGVFGGNIKPSPFLCLTLKMLQIQPEKDIVVEFIRNEEFKYVRALGALYMRLVGTGLECYKYLEPLFNDGRKLRRRNRSGQFELVHMDEFIDELLREERSCDVILPRLQKRQVLEESNELEPRTSAALDDYDADEAVESSSESDDGIAPQRTPQPPPPPTSRHRERRRSRSRSPARGNAASAQHHRRSRREHDDRRTDREDRPPRDERPTRDERTRDDRPTREDRSKRAREDRREYDHRRDYDHRNDDRRDYDHRNDDRRDYDHRNDDRRAYDHRNDERREYDQRNDERRDHDRRDYEQRREREGRYEQEHRRRQDHRSDHRDRKTVY